MTITHTWHDLVHDMRDEMHDVAAIGRVDAIRQSYLGLWLTLTALPLILGLDKFVGVMSDSWSSYLAGWANTLIPGSAANAMMWIGAVEILLAILVFAVPRVGGDLLALWMLLTAINLFSIDRFTELGVAALALAACALCMAHMSTAYHHREETTTGATM